jgi:hypothetical protein
VGAGYQQRIMGNQAAPRDTLAEFAAIVMQLLRGTVAVSGWPRTAAVPPPPRV